jgi:glucosamine-6-phosphate deaminase
MSPVDGHPARLFYVDLMEVRVFGAKEELGRCAARHAATRIRDAVERRGSARIVLATGVSQFAFFKALVEEDVDWSKVEVLHLDEYAGIGPDHPASLRRYLRERLIAVVRPAAFREISGEAPDLDAECERYSAVLSERDVDLCVCGIGENGHLAFNDPPVADFEDEKLVKVVELDEACRRQQFGEGWFEAFEDVPARGVTLTIPALLSARLVIVGVPEKRKAEAVAKAIGGPVATSCPASILRRNAHAVLYLDEESASGI